MRRSCLLFSFIFISIWVYSQRAMEYLDRGVVAVPDKAGNVFVSWRLLASDSDDIAFNIYRKINGKTEKLNTRPISDITSFTDELKDNTSSREYIIRAVINNKEQSQHEGYFILKDPSKPYLSIPLQIPAGYAANDASVGDVDGDGEYEIILHVAGKGNDNSHAGFTDAPLIQAYKLNGTLLWTINLGKNIREGAHYTQFLVYDFDGDGMAEVAMKTADGSMDGKGNVIGDSTKDWRNDKGYILSGPEYLSIFNGLTGEVINTTNFIPPRASTIDFEPKELKQLWGDFYGNRMDRFLGAVAYLDGKHPSLIMSRGYYTRTVITAWDFKNGKLVKRWTFDSNDKGNKAYAGQGNHNLSIADVDNDGKDEIVFGAMCIDDNGKGLYSTGLGHGDALHVSDLDPSIPGLEVFDIQERFDDAGCSFRSAATGTIYWKKASVKAGEDGEGPGRGLALDIDPRYPGFECWVAGAGIKGMFDCKGNKIADATPACNMGIYWDGDVLSEILNGTFIGKWDYEKSITNELLNTSRYQCRSNNGTKQNPVLSADIFGDWREEVIYRTSDNKELRIFSTSIPTEHKFNTLMHDPQYRLSIAWQNVGYNQPPHTSYFMGEGMSKPPKPNIIYVQKKK